MPLTPAQAIYATVKKICDRLTDDEIAAVNMIALLNSDPRGRAGSDKYLPLFDAADGYGVPHMSDSTKAALDRIVSERFP